MTEERWLELRRLFSDLEFDMPPDTVVQFGIKGGYSFEGYLSTMGTAEDENGRDESAATMEINDDGKIKLYTFRMSEFTWLKFAGSEWETD